MPLRYSQSEEQDVFDRAIQLQVAAQYPAVESQTTIPASPHQKPVRTLEEMVQTAIEAGIDPKYIRQALSEQETGTQKQSATVQRSSANATSYLWAGFGIPFIYGTLAYLLRHDVACAQFFTLVASGPTCLLLGFLAPRKRLGAMAALTLVLALTATFHEIIGTGFARILNIGVSFEPAREFLTVQMGAGLAMLLGTLGAWARHQIASAPSELDRRA